MSAATMVACSADEIVLGDSSSLGPTDPQMPVVTEIGRTEWAPAQLLLREAEGTGYVTGWLGQLERLNPGLLATCRDAVKLTDELVTEWLAAYMFAADPARTRHSKARRISAFLASYETHKTHGRLLGRERLRALGLLVADLEADQTTQDLVLSIHHATDHTFAGTGIVKIVENHLGHGSVKLA